MANEKRLIWDIELEGKVCAGCKKEFPNKSCEPFQCSIRETIAECKTVDAVEVVHGRWEDEYGGKYANPRYRCSVCKERALYKFERDLLGSWKEAQTLTPNCPYCLAKLDGGN